MRMRAPLAAAALLALGCNAIFGMNDLEFGDGGSGDTDGDTDTDTADDPPTIADIDGDGTALAVNDVDGVTSGIADALPASHRFQKKWVIQGTRLDTVDEVDLAQTDGGGAWFGAEDGLAFETGGTAMQRNLTLPAALVAGAFTLTVGNGFGEASAQVYVLQGEKGDPGEGLSCDGTTCTVTGDQDLIVNGSVTAEAGDFASLTADALTVVTSYWLPECPVGYARDGAVSDLVLCAKGDDQVVKVGDFWVDRYEASLWSASDCSGTQYGAASDDYPEPGFPDNGNWATPVYACSVAGVLPSAYVTWFQAQQACALAGKRLCTNEEWQAAAAGTHDPGTAETGTQCRIAATNTAARATGLAGTAPGASTTCVSMWGAQDAIGNVWEWVAAWSQAGVTWATADGASAAAWDAEYGSDETSNINGEAYDGATSAWVSGLPGAAIRGGYWSGDTASGEFTFNLNNGPTNSNSTVGLRCCLDR